MSTPAVAEHGPAKIERVRTPEGTMPWEDFTAQAVLSIATKLARHVRDQSRPSVVIAHEFVARTVIAARRCCVNDGCLLLSGERCLICGVVA